MKIEKSIPIPDRDGVGGNIRRYDYLYQMEIGDSVLDSNADASSNSRIYNNAKQIQTRGIAKFMARKVDGGVRIWRIE